MMEVREGEELFRNLEEAIIRRNEAVYPPQERSRTAFKAQRFQQLYKEQFLTSHPKSKHSNDVQLSPVDVSPSGQVILGTRDLESPEGISRNSIYSANFDSVKKSVDFDALAPSTWEIAVGDYIQDLRWIDSNHFMAAAGSSLVLGQTNSDGSFHEKLHFKGIHEDLIRELDISTDYGVPLVLSGGYDGEVLISNIQQLVDYADFPGKGYVMAYDVHQVVSSVSWNRFCSNLALATTEHGYLHMFDTRMSGHEGNAQVYNSHKNLLYSHCMISDHVIYLGFGDGILSGIDIRMLNGMSLVDNSSIPGVGSIGSLRYSEICQSLIVLGNKGTAFFVNDENTLKPIGALDTLICEGSFMENGEEVAFTTSDGSLLVIRFSM